MKTLIIRNADSSEMITYRINLFGLIDENVATPGTRFTIMDILVNDEWSIDNDTRRALVALGAPDKQEINTIQGFITIVNDMSGFGLFITSSDEESRGQVQIVAIS